MSRSRSGATPGLDGPVTRLALLGLVVVGAVLAVGCGSLTFPEREATIEGEIVGIGSAVPFGSERTFWVKAAADSPCGIVFRLGEHTRIGRREPDDSVTDAGFPDLSVGLRVRVWARSVADSCPGQAVADHVEIPLAVDIG